jgi:hypothetical protein
MLFENNFPSPKLLIESSRFEYEILAECVYKGDLKAFDNFVEEYKYLWILRGLYMTFQRLKAVVIRNLFRKTYLLYRRKFPNENNIPISFFVKAYNFSCRPDDKTDEFGI